VTWGFGRHRCERSYWDGKFVTVSDVTANGMGAAIHNKYYRRAYRFVNRNISAVFSVG
jgi:hypothetical protein